MTSATHDLAKLIVAAEAEDPSSAPHVAEAAKHICEKLTEHLARLVGQRGILTLLSRSLTLTRPTVPWLASIGTASADAQWEPLQTCLSGQDAASAAEALTLFVAQFIGLLGRLVGNSLAVRLLQEIWPALPGVMETT